jgi:hypothetical protein
VLGDVAVLEALDHEEEVRAVGGDVEEVDVLEVRGVGVRRLNVPSDGYIFCFQEFICQVKIKEFSGKIFTTIFVRCEEVYVLFLHRLFGGKGIVEEDIPAYSHEGYGGASTVGNHEREGLVIPGVAIMVGELVVEEEFVREGVRRVPVEAFGNLAELTGGREGDTCEGIRGGVRPVGAGGVAGDDQGIVSYRLGFRRDGVGRVSGEEISGAYEGD